MWVSWRLFWTSYPRLRPLPHSQRHGKGLLFDENLERSSLCQEGRVLSGNANTKRSNARSNRPAATRGEKRRSPRGSSISSGRNAEKPRARGSVGKGDLAGSEGGAER